MVTIFMAVLELLKQQVMEMRYEDDDIIFTAALDGAVQKGDYMSLATMHLEAVLFAAAKPISIDMLEEVFGLFTRRHTSLYKLN